MLQIWHLALLALVPVLFSIFRLLSETYDPSRALIENLIFIFAGVLTSYTLVHFIITGRKDEAIPNLFKLYRNALSQIPFLLISNIVLTACLLILLYQLTCFRQVEFLSPIDAEIYLGDEIGKKNRLGFVRSKTPAYFRLKNGGHLVAIKKVETQEWVEAKSISVPNIFENQGLVSIWIQPKEDNFVELE